MKNIKKIATLCTLLATLLLAACNGSGQGKTFTVKGNIADGTDKEISVYRIAEGGAKEIEKKKLDKNGNYEFNIPSPEHFDFYILNVEEGGRIVFIADSTETITINSNIASLTADYTVDGNGENLRIKEIMELRDALEEQVKVMASSTSPA